MGDHADDIIEGRVNPFTGEWNHPAPRQSRIEREWFHARNQSPEQTLSNLMKQHSANYGFAQSEIPLILEDFANQTEKFKGWKASEIEKMLGESKRIRRAFAKYLKNRFT